MIKNLPQGWRVEKLGKVAEYINGKAFKPSEWAESGLPIVRIQNLNGNENYNFYDGEIEEKYLIHKGDILISWSASLDVYKWDKEEAVLNQHIFNTKINNKLITDDYFYYTIKKALVKILSNLHGSTMQHITKGRFEDIEILLPPLPQQEKIVKVLDKSASLVEQQKQLIEKYDVFLKSKFIEMFGDPITNPMGWEVKKLGDLAKVQTGKTPSRKNSDYWTNGTVNWAKTTEVNQNYIIEVEEKITDLAVKECHMIVFQENTILIAMYGQGKTRGKVVLLGVSATINQAFGAILPSSKYETLYLLKLLDYMYENIRDLGRGGNQENLNLDIVRGINIILPPKELQNKFAFLATKIQAIKEK